MTADDIAQALGVNRRTVYEWRKLGMPCEELSDGRMVVDWFELCRWMAKKKSLRTVGEGGGESESELKKEKLRLENEQRRMRIAKLSGELVDRESAKAELRRQYAIVRARLEAVPGEMAVSVPPDLRADVLSDWKNRVRLTLKELEGMSDA